MARSQRIYLLAAALLTLSCLYPIDGNPRPRESILPYLRVAPGWMLMDGVFFVGRVLLAGKEKDEADEPAPVRRAHQFPFATPTGIASLGV